MTYCPTWLAVERATGIIINNSGKFEAGMCTRPFRPRPSVRDETETETLQVAETLPRRLVKSSKQSPQVAAKFPCVIWSGIRANHIAFIIWAFCGLVNAVVGLPYVILVSVVYWYVVGAALPLLLRSGLTSFQQSVTSPVPVNLLPNCDLK